MVFLPICADNVMESGRLCIIYLQREVNEYGNDFKVVRFKI